jgi:hypothetical protein
MKITGTIEISGCNRVVFYKKNLFDRISTKNGSYWYDMRRNRRLSSETMADIIRTMAMHPARRVWTEGGTINIDRKKLNKLARFYKELDDTMIVRRIERCSTSTRGMHGQ